MTKINNRLRPFHVFKDELTRINALYWLSSYSYERTKIGLIARAPSSANNITLHQLWPSRLRDMRKATLITLSEFDKATGDNTASIRLTSTIYVCSAFENALSSYFILCVLHDPHSFDSTWRHGACPHLLQSPTHFLALRDAATDAAGASIKKSVLKGTYSKRLQFIDKTFGLGIGLGTLPLARLDAHYSRRHLVAHDQGLTIADDPARSIGEILAIRPTVSEQEWKSMLDEFLTTIDILDRSVRSKFVTDCGVALAVSRVLERSNHHGRGLSVGDIRFMVAEGWRIEPSTDDIISALGQLGRTTTSVAAKRRRRVL